MQRIFNSSKDTETDASAVGPEAALFADPWRRFKPQTLFLHVARYSLRSWSELLPLALIFLVIAVAVGVGAALAVPRLESAERTLRISAAVRATLLVLLILTPFGVARSLKVLLRRTTGRLVPIERIRYYRLVGSMIYLALPVSVLVSVFPLGLLILPFYFWWMFAPFVILVEGEGGRTALRRSRMLSMGEFSRTALPATLALALFFVGIAMAQRLVPSPPKGFQVDEGGDYTRALAEGETYDPKTETLTQPDGTLVPIPEGARYDDETRTLALPAAAPVPMTTAFLWVGIPVLIAGLLDPIRWALLTWLYLNLRMRREGLTLASLLDEIETNTTTETG